MIASPLLGPAGDLPAERQITANPPEYHSHVSLDVMAPPGPIGPGFISPSTVHFPTKYPRRFCSGPGFAAAPGACAAARPCHPATTMTPSAISRTVLFIGYLLLCV